MKPLSLFLLKKKSHPLGAYRIYVYTKNPKGGVKIITNVDGVGKAASRVILEDHDSSHAHSDYCANFEKQLNTGVLPADKVIEWVITPRLAPIVDTKAEIVKALEAALVDAKKPAEVPKVKGKKKVKC